MHKPTILEAVEAENAKLRRQVTQYQQALQKANAENGITDAINAANADRDALRARLSEVTLAYQEAEEKLRSVDRWRRDSYRLAKKEEEWERREAALRQLLEPMMPIIELVVRKEVRMAMDDAAYDQEV